MPIHLVPIHLHYVVLQPLRAIPEMFRLIIAPICYCILGMHILSLFGYAVARAMQFFVGIRIWSAFVISCLKFALFLCGVFLALGLESLRGRAVTDFLTGAPCLLFSHACSCSFPGMHPEDLGIALSFSLRIALPLLVCTQALCPSDHTPRAFPGAPYCCSASSSASSSAFCAIAFYHGSLAPSRSLLGSLQKLSKSPLPWTVLGGQSSRSSRCPFGASSPRPTTFSWSRRSCCIWRSEI